MAETSKDDDDSMAVAILRIAKFRLLPERVFYLYKGLNIVGRDPYRCTVSLYEEFISRAHLYLDVAPPLVWVKDGAKRPGQIATCIAVDETSRLSMDPDSWYEFNPARKLKIANLLTAFLELLSDEERNEAPRKGYVSEEAQRIMDDKVNLDETFVEGGPVAPSHQSSRPSIEPIDYHNNVDNGCGNSTIEDEEKPLSNHHSIEPSYHSQDSTQVIPELTLVVREEKYRPRRYDRLPDYPRIPGVSPDITLQRPVMGGPGRFNADSRTDFSVLENYKEYFAKFDASNHIRTINNEPTLVVEEDSLADFSQISIIVPPSPQPVVPSLVLEDKVVINSEGRSDQRELEDGNDAGSLDGGDDNGDNDDDVDEGESSSGSEEFESPQVTQQEITRMISTGQATVKDTDEQDRMSKIPEEQQPDPYQEQQENQQQHTTAPDILTLASNRQLESIPDSQVSQEAAKLSRSSPPRRKMSKEAFCPDSQSSSRPSSREHSRGDASDTTAVDDSTPFAATVSLAIVNSQSTGQDFARTRLKRKGSLKHHRETDDSAQEEEESTTSSKRTPPR
ncbi:hypothetical protein BGX24_011797 [Mortierella sp. AD032]|nr:hypothetical protein BGX24_011797 [Mortierella sp. AD032]